MNTVTPGKKRKIHHDNDDDHYNVYRTSKASSTLAISEVETPLKKPRKAKRRRVVDFESNAHATQKYTERDGDVSDNGDKSAPLSSNIPESHIRVHDNVNHNSEVSVEVSSPSSSLSSASIPSTCLNQVLATSTQTYAVTTNNDGSSGKVTTDQLKLMSRPQLSKNPATRDVAETNMDKTMHSTIAKPAVVVFDNPVRSLPSVREEEVACMEVERKAGSFEDHHKIDPEYDECERYSGPVLTSVSSATPSSWWKFFRIIYKSCLCSVLVYLGRFAYQNHSRSQYMSNLLQTQLHESEVSLARVAKEHSHTLNNLAAMTIELGEATTQKEECSSQLDAITHEVAIIRDEKDALFLKKIGLEERLHSMTGAEDHVQKALVKAYQLHDDLKRELEQLDTLRKSCAVSLSQAQDTISASAHEGQECAHRIVDLELSMVDVGAQLEDHLTKIRLGEERNQQLQHEILEAQDNIALLQHQLVEEDSRSWYYELQLQHLEDVGEVQDNVISDLKYENTKLRDEIGQLRDTLDRQLEGGIAALNAVAKSATRRKEEQFRHVVLGADRRVDQAKREAVHAIHSVLLASGNK